MDDYMFEKVCKEQGCCYRISQRTDNPLWEEWQFVYVTKKDLKDPEKYNCFMCNKPAIENE